MLIINSVFYHLVLILKGVGSVSDWSFCRNNVCSLGQGDCDKNSECSGSLVCGTNNCRDFHANALAYADCCMGEFFTLKLDNLIFAMIKKLGNP